MSDIISNVSIILNGILINLAQVFNMILSNDLIKYILLVSISIGIIFLVINIIKGFSDSSGVTYYDGSFVKYGKKGDIDFIALGTPDNVKQVIYRKN